MDENNPTTSRERQQHLTMGLDADADTVDDKPQVVSDAGGASSENDFEYGLCSCFSNCDICTLPSRCRFHFLFRFSLFYFNIVFFVLLPLF